MEKIKVGITVGDPAGIGPEITRKALSSSSLRKSAEFLVIDSSYSKKIKKGKISKISGECALKNIDIAIELLRTKAIDALVTAPVSKSAINLINKGFIGHTEYIARSFKVKDFAMFFVSAHFRLALVTRHLPLKDVPGNLKQRNIFDTIKLTAWGLGKYFNVKSPRIAVCGLNPHAGEAGLLGLEEKRVIIPAVRQAQKRGIKVVGPLAGDSLFFDAYHQKFDAVITMYHDQGLIPLKMIDRFSSVNLTLGLGFARTSPSHGTAFDIVGKNIADPASMIEAIKLAIKCTQNLRKA